MARLIDADELLAALQGQAVPYAVAEALRNAAPAPRILTHASVLAAYSDALARTGSTDDALFRAACFAYQLGRSTK